jgi:HD-GYP domain-containing protein (c-di-GMP phosphodiesterase class II)
VTDTEAAIQESNQAAADLLQTQMVFLLGQRLGFFVTPDDQKIFTSMMDLARQGSGPKVRLVRVQPPGGSPRPVFLGIAGRRNPTGELVGFNWLMQAYTRNRQEDEVLQGQLAKLEARFIGLVTAFSVAAEMQDPYSAGHQQRVAQLACGIGEQMGFSPDRVAGMKIMGQLHDVGKVAIPPGILNKVGLLTVVECNIVKSHPQLGYDLLKNIEFPWPVAQAILQHHERWDGSGYPAGLSGEEIIIEARILAVADVVEAMVSPRPYGVAVGLEKALEEVYKEAGVLYDPQVVDAALKLFVEKGFKFA